MSVIPKTLFEFKEYAFSNLNGNRDTGGGKAHLKVQLIETNVSEMPRISGYSEWTPLEDTSRWYVAYNHGDYFVVNKVNDRVWAVYSLIEVKKFKKTMSSWINGNMFLDNCWFSVGSMKSVMNKMNWGESGIGLRFENSVSGCSDPVNISVKAWYGSDATIGDMFKDARENFSINSMRMKSHGEDETTSEWYTSGRITFNASDDIDSVIYATNSVCNHYFDELTHATKLRDSERGAFEFEFKRNVDLDSYARNVIKGKNNLKLWMIRTEAYSDFMRFQGVDTHTWDRIMLDMGNNYAFMSVPGKGCVNAAPRLISIQGETVTGNTKAYYNGNEIFA